MLRYARGRGLLRCGEAWFDEDVEADGIDILEYVQISSPPRNLRSEPFPTLLIDLEPSPEEILAGFDKTTRYEVRRGLGRDGVRTMWHPDVDDELLQRFISDYERFARARQLPPASRRRLDAMRAARALVLSRAELDGAAHAWHAYIRVDDRVRLLLSSTADRSSSTELRAQIGRSNRALHYADAVAAKEAGARWLDLGGVSNQPDGPLRSVDAFKAGFGGRPAVGWNAVEAKSARGRAALAATHVLSKVRESRRNGERAPAG